MFLKGVKESRVSETEEMSVAESAFVIMSRDCQADGFYLASSL